MYRIWFLLFFLAGSLWATGQSYEELNNKMVRLYKEEKYAEAIPIAIKIKDIAQKQFGTESGNYARALNKLALLYKNTGNYAAAEPLYKQSLAILKKISGESDPDYETILNNLAKLYEQMGDYVNAESFYKQLLTVEKKTLGEEHPYYTNSLNNLGKLYQKIRNYTGAESFYKQALAINRRVLGDSHLTVAMNLHNLGGLYESMLNYAAAEPLYKQVSEICKKKLGEKNPDYIKSLSTLAELHRKIDNSNMVKLNNEVKKEEALLIAIKVKDDTEKKFGDTSISYAYILNNLAGLYESVGNYAAAEPLNKQALTIFKKVFGEAHPDYATSLDNLAYLYQRMGNYAAAEPLNKQALAIYKKALGEEHPDYIQSLNNLAVLNQRMGNFTAAELLYKEALAIRKKASGEEHTDYVSSLYNLAGLYMDKGNYAAAEPLYKLALTINKKIYGPEHSNYATSLNNLALLYEKTGNYIAGERLYNQASAIYKKVLGEEHPDYATSLNNLAALYKNIGNYAAAERLFKQALTIRKKALGEENSYFAQSLNNLAYLYQSMSNYAAAEPLFIQALTIIKKILGEDHPDYAQSLNNLAILYESIGNYDAAAPLFKQSVTIYKKTLGDEHPDYAASLSNIADFYETVGDYSKAEPLLERASAIFKKALGDEHPSYANSLGHLAGLYKRMGNYATAESLLKQDLTIIKKVLGEEHPDYASNLTDLGILYQTMGNYAAAEALYKQALAIGKKIFGENHKHYAEVLKILAVLYECIDNYVAAEKYLIAGTNITFRHIENNLNTFSESEKLKWWEREKVNFEIAPSLLFTNPNVSPGFLQQSCSEQLQLKGFVLNDGAKVLQEARKKGDPQLQQLLNQWQNNKAILAKQYGLPIAKRMPRLDSLEKQTNEQEKQINRQSVAFQTSSENKQIGFPQVRHQLKQDEAAVEFIRFDYYHKKWTDSILYAAFIILANDTVPHFVTLCEEKELASLLDSKTNSSEEFVKQLYRGVTLSNSQADGKKGDHLYNLVWKPLLPWLKGIKKINIAPAGLLNRVAFNALPVDSSTYLIDTYQLRQYVSVRQIAEKKIPVSNTDAADAVLYGGIDFSGADKITTPGKVTVTNILPDNVKRSIRGGVWTSLPGTLQEVNSISQLFKTNKKTTWVITGSAATEESFKQLSTHSPAILHLATHGFSLPDAEQKRKDDLNNSDNQFTLADNPLMRSGIIMAGANRVWGGDAPVAGKEDGIVTAYEISNLDLSNTDLVVLSACETALGDIKGTEGVFGLQRAFKLAGVQNMILSLWQVPDKETAELMNLLYTNKLKGLTNYEAFNKAQDIMRKKYPPYYWAAFVLME
jgi:tetratricopeptide (TPR) repeat protein